MSQPWISGLNEEITSDVRPEPKRVQIVTGHQLQPRAETKAELCRRLRVRLASRQEYVEAVLTGLDHGPGFPIWVADEWRASGRGTPALHGFFVNPKNDQPLFEAVIQERYWRRRQVKRGMRQRCWRFAVVPL